MDQLQLGEEEYFLWRSLDGKRSFAELQEEFRTRFNGQISWDQFQAFVSQLVESGLVEALPDEAAAQYTNAGQADDGAVTTVESHRGWDEDVAVRLGRPVVSFRALDWLLGPLRYYRWLLLPSLIIVLAGWMFSAPAMLAGVSVLTAVDVLAIAAVALFLTGTIPPFAKGVVASFQGSSDIHYGIASRFGFLPQLKLGDSLDEAVDDRLSPQRALIVAATPLIARALLFIAGTGIWLWERDSGGLLPAAALVTGQCALISFLISALPLVPSDGRRCLQIALGVSVSAGAPVGRYRYHLIAVSIFWGLLTAGIALLYAALLLDVASGLPSNISAVLWTIAWIFVIGAPLGMRFWYPTMARHRATPRKVHHSLGSAAVVVPFERDGVPPAAMQHRRYMAQNWPSPAPVIALAAVLAVLEAFAFVPYPYAAGGDFKILPHDASQINARVQGELVEVLVNEGDAVTAGQLLGTLSDWDQRHGVDLARAQLENAQANLQNLLDSPRPEDVELARQQYEAAMAKLPYSKAQYERAAQLVKTEAIARSTYDLVLSQYEQDQAAVEVAQANYSQVRAGATNAEIEAARALVRQQSAQLAYAEDQLERTRVRATSAGRIVTANPMLLRGKWFNPAVPEGAQVFTIEDDQIAQTDVYVPETDIANVRVNAPVRARLWAHPEETFTGKVVAIAPSAEPDPNGSTGNVVRIKVEIPNPEHRLRTGMNGYAKIEGDYMPTWRAFGQMVIRFILIDVWSWIP
jgi:multidrug resistance efflux pump